MAPGPLALVGGDEFRPGNEATDRLLAERGGPAYVLATAAARQNPGAAVATARAWFAALGLGVEELRVLRRADALDDEVARRARDGRFFYLAGGDPGLVVDVLKDSPVWAAIVAAWRSGAALAGSSAGAMALGEWTLLREKWPNHQRRRLAPALGLLPGLAVVPHYDTSGHRWSAPDGPTLVGVDERTAALWLDGEWRTTGQGRVTLLSGRGLPQPLVASGDSRSEVV